jgi:hypothetical protein
LHEPVAFSHGGGGKATASATKCEVANALTCGLPGNPVALCVCACGHAPGRRNDVRYRVCAGRSSRERADARCPSDQFPCLPVGSMGQ